MTMLSRVETAPWTTGAIINSSAIWTRRLRPPMLVTKPCPINIIHTKNQHNAIPF